jgi:hypothetical protein
MVAGLIHNTISAHDPLDDEDEISSASLRQKYKVEIEEITEKDILFAEKATLLRDEE